MHYAYLIAHWCTLQLQYFSISKWLPWLLQRSPSGHESWASWASRASCKEAGNQAAIVRPEPLKRQTLHSFELEVATQLCFSAMPSKCPRTQNRVGPVGTWQQLPTFYILPHPLLYNWNQRLPETFSSGHFSTKKCFPRGNMQRPQNFAKVFLLDV